MFGKYSEHVLIIYGMCFENVWSMCGQCLKHVWNAFASCLEHVATIRGACRSCMHRAMPCTCTRCAQCGMLHMHPCSCDSVPLAARFHLLLVGSASALLALPLWAQVLNEAKPIPSGAYAQGHMRIGTQAAYPLKCTGTGTGACAGMLAHGCIRVCAYS